MRSQVRLYEHPELKAEKEDITLLSTVCLVLALAATGAFFILTMSCLFFWDDCRNSYGLLSRRIAYLPVRQLVNQ